MREQLSTGAYLWGFLSSNPKINLLLVEKAYEYAKNQWKTPQNPKTLRNCFVRMPLNGRQGLCLEASFLQILEFALTFQPAVKNGILLIESMVAVKYAAISM